MTLASRVALLAAVTLACERGYQPVSTPQFADVTQAAGLSRVSPTYDAAIGDFDGDGWPDIYVGNHATGAVLLRNLGDGRFTDVLAGSGIDAFGDQHGVGWTDYDNDGRLDLVVTVGAGRGLVAKQNRLYHNEGGGRFRDVAASAGVTDPHGRSRSVAWLDVDRDGWLDLLVANHASPNRLFRNRSDGTFEDVSEAFGIAALSATRVSWGDYDDDGYPDVVFTGTPAGVRLLHNQQGRRFVDATEESGLDRVHRSTAALIFGDYDNDGMLDLYGSIGTDFSDVVDEHEGARVTFAFFAREEPNGFDFETADPDAAGVALTLYENGSAAASGRIVCGSAPRPAAGEFRCQGEAATSDGMPGGEIGFAIWRDPLPRRLCTQCPSAYTWHLRWRGPGDHHLTGVVQGAVHPVAVGLRPGGASGGMLYRAVGDGRFKKHKHAGLVHQGNGQAAQWTDLNNDGWLDLYVVDSGTDGAGGRNRLFLNDQRGRFVAADATAGVDPPSGVGRGSGAHAFDFDADGRLDLFLTNGWGAPPFDRGPYYLLQNRSAPAHWLAVHLEGVRSNRPGLGAWLEIEACGTRQVRYHNGATSYFSQSIVDPHFGLGDCTVVRTLRVRWPSGERSERREVAVDQRLLVREGELDVPVAADHPLGRHDDRRAYSRAVDAMR